MQWRRKWQPILVFLPGESQGQGSLVGCRLWGRTELDMTEEMQQQQQGGIISLTQTLLFCRTRLPVSPVKPPVWCLRIGERFPFWISADSTGSLRFPTKKFLKMLGQLYMWSWTMDPCGNKRLFYPQKAEKYLKSSITAVLLNPPCWCFVAFWISFCSFILQLDMWVTGWSPVTGQ